MANELDAAINQIKDMLSTDQGQQTISSIISGLTGGGDPPAVSSSSLSTTSTTPDVSPSTSAASTSPLSGLGALMSGGGLGDMMELFNKLSHMGDNDAGVRLLNALRPFISEERHGHIDDAVRILLVTKLPKMLK